MVNDFNVTHEDSIAHPWSAKKGYYPRRLENLPLSKMCHPKLWREKEMGNGPHFWNNYTAGLMMIDDYYSLKRRQTTGIEQLNYDTGCFKAYIPAGESEEDHPKSYFHHRQLKKNSSEQQIPYIFKIQILVGSCLCEYLWDTRVFSTFCLMWCGW